MILADSIPDVMKWPSEVAKAAADTLSERNDVRYNATVKLAELDNPVVAPLLGCLLADKECPPAHPLLRQGFKPLSNS